MFFKEILPQAFIDKYETLMTKEESQSFFAALTTGESKRSFRINPIKVNPNKLLDKYAISASRVPYCEYGYFLSDEVENVGLKSYHQNGSIYMQEASAMAVCESIDLKSDWKVLDMCAAPGGKSTHIASKLTTGLLVLNEFVYKRARILSGNIERCGITNSIVVCAEPNSVADCFEGYFDAVFVDAPCSGEGMFRKDKVAINEWSADSVELCSKRSYSILTHAARCVSNGGYIIYSTCTYSPEENERLIAKFLIEHPDFELIDVTDRVREASIKGRIDWLDKDYPQNIKDSIAKIARFMPHKTIGEGHCIAVLRKTSLGTNILLNKDSAVEMKSLTREEKVEVKKLLSGLLIDFDGNYVKYQDNILMLPPFTPSVKGLAVLRYGLNVATFDRGRLIPSHALAVSAKYDNIKNKVDVSGESDLYKKYVGGEELEIETEYDGWGVFCVDGVSLGLFKASNGKLKNHYPKALRMKIK